MGHRSSNTPTKFSELEVDGAADIEKLSGIYDHIVSNSVQLDNALQDAEANKSVTIFIAPGVYTPANAPYALSEGTAIIGHHAAEDGFAVDGNVANNGTRIDAGGGILFDVDAVSGLRLENFAVDNYQHALRCGGQTTNGLSTSVLRNLSFTNGTDYALKLFNFHRVRMDSVIQSAGPGLVHAINTQDKTVFQAGNSTWTDILSSVDEDVSNAPIWLEAQNVDSRLNYITMLRPQVISSAATNGAGAAAIQIDSDGSSGANSQLHTIVGADLEGDFAYKFRCGAGGKSNYLSLAGTAGSSTYDAFLEDAHNHVHFQIPGDVYSDSETNSISGDVTGVSGSRVTGLVHNTGSSANATLYPGLNATSVDFETDQVKFNGSGNPIRSFADFVFGTPTDLSGTTGDWDGEMSLDDGTNTAARATPCVWDETNSVWRPVNDPSTGSFT